MEPCGLSWLGFWYIHVNPYKATNTSDIHSCRETAKSPALGSYGRWAEQDDWSHILRPSIFKGRPKPHWEGGLLVGHPATRTQPDTWGKPVLLRGEGRCPSHHTRASELPSGDK